MLGSQAIVDEEHATPGGAAEAGGEIAMRIERADHVAAAVQIEDGLRIRHRRRGDPLRRHAADLDGLRAHVGIEGKGPRHRFEAGAHFRSRPLTREGIRG